MNVATNKPPEGFGFLYLVRSPSGKGYVGQTRMSLRRRWAQHVRRAMCVYIHNAITKYGADAMVVSVLGVFPVEKLNEEEARFISELGTLAPQGYNLRSGGGVGGTNHPETRAKLSAAAKKRFSDPEARARVAEVRRGTHLGRETRAKLAAAMRGRVFSLETRAKISAAKLGHSVSAEARAKISQARKGVHPSAATRAKMSRYQQGRASDSEETRLKRSVALRGRPFSAETRRRMSEAAKRRREDPEVRAQLLAQIALGKENAKARNAEKRS